MDIYRDSQQSLPFKLYINRTLTDADSLPTVRLSLNGTDLPAHTVEHDGEGVYSTTLLFSDLTEDGDLEAYWTFEYNSVETTKRELHNVVTPYIDLAYLYELEHNDDEVEAAEKYARHAIEKFTGQSFGKRSGWVKAQGHGTDVLVLPERVLQIDYLYQNGELVWDKTETINIFQDVEPVGSKFGIQIAQNGSDIDEYESTSALRAGGSFIADYTYEVVGTFGYEDVPGDIMLCGKLLVEDYFCKDRAWRQKWATKVSTGDWSIDLDPHLFSGTGNSYVDATLSDYVWHRMVII